MIITRKPLRERGFSCDFRENDRNENEYLQQLEVFTIIRLVRKKRLSKHRGAVITDMPVGCDGQAWKNEICKINSIGDRINEDRHDNREANENDY